MRIYKPNMPMIRLTPAPNMELSLGTMWGSSSRRKSLTLALRMGVMSDCRSGFEYIAFVDPSGGGSDAFTLSVCHKEGERASLIAFGQLGRLCHRIASPRNSRTF